MNIKDPGFYLIRERKNILLIRTPEIMMHEINYTDFIERYLKNEMTSDEKAWFEKEKEGNSALQEEINFHKKLDSVLADKETIEFKAQLELIHNEINETAREGSRLVNGFYKKATMVIGAFASVAIVVTLYLYNYNFSNEKLIAEYYQPIESSMSFRSASNSTDVLSEAMKLYEIQEYSKAIELFESILQEGSSKPSINLYSGISHMELKNYSMANERFKAILDEEPNPFVESATWYLGLCYLFTNEREKARESFLVLEKSDGYYKASAKKILRRL
jgi:hypothetical protein